ncbi:MAG: 6-hydroxymethylpterin diphosphokinase MptE-like protein [Shewanella sp.]|uniref:motility associated factor glycosyltransferase family protein n=1 Tax=Shewanella sp. TaxID=50422 RepID=UPI003002FBD7
MSELFEQNIAIINKRWPQIAKHLKQTSFEHLDAQLVTGLTQTIRVNGVQLSSRHDRIAEAKLFIETLPQSASKVSLYGIGMGDTVSLLVDNPTLQEINIYLLNMAMFALLLTYTDQQEWLDDARVKLMASTDPFAIGSPYIASTPDLQLADNINAATRDILAQENHREFTNRHHQDHDPAIEQRLADNLNFLNQDQDAATLTDLYQNRDVFVIGAGPTLEQFYGYILNKLSSSPPPLIIAVDTAFKALAYNGITPDIVISIDAKITPAHLPSAVSDTVKLVYFPRVMTSLLKAWPGERFAAYSQTSMYQKLNEKNPRLQLFCNGSVIHPAVDLAIKMQPSSIALFGCDFCYANNKTHAFWNDGDLGPKVSVSKKHLIENGQGEQVTTDLNFRGYLRSLEKLIYQHPEIDFYQSSPQSAKLLGVPLLSL